MKRFEVGVTYQNKKNGNLFLAIDHQKLAFFQKQKLRTTTRIPAEYTIVHLSVDELCKQWNISPTKLDTLSSKFLAPNPTAIRPAPRGTYQRKLRGDDREQNFRDRRLVKVVI